MIAKGVDIADDTYDTVRFVKAADLIDDFGDGGKMLNRIGNATDYHKLTKSNHVDGTRLHTLFMKNGSKIDGTRLRVDGLDPITKTIFELKPYNKRNIRKSVKQITNYNILFGNGHKMVVVLY